MILRPRTRLAAAVLAIALGSILVRADGGLADDVKARRARVMEKVGPDALAILWSAPPARYSLDVDYEYRQDSNLYYLTGITQEDTILVLMPGNATRREILFVKDLDPVREHWTGHRLTVAEATAASAITTVLATSQFDAFVSAMLNRQAFGAVDEKEAAHFFDALASGRAKVVLPLDAGRTVTGPLSHALQFARDIRDRFLGFGVADLTPVLTDLRTVKTPFERSVLIQSLEISAEAQKAGMRAARPGVHEYEVKAAIESSYRSHGAVSWSYPPIVGSGPNATVLHYADSRRQLRDGELLLVDAAANYEYASGDITRTYPVNGRFSAPQRELYSIVLEAQEAAIATVRPGVTLRDVHQKTVDVIKAGLLRLGLITDATGDQYKMWYTHGSTHYIGLDVHDVGDRSRPLTPGMAFVIEPGLYIRQSALDALPRSADNDALIAKLKPVVQKYADIGVRVEDSFLLEDDGLRRLSTGVPRTIEEIEAFMRNR